MRVQRQGRMSRKRRRPPSRCGCLIRIGQGNVNNNFEWYWKICDYEKQNAYINNCIKSVDVTRYQVKDRLSCRLRSVTQANNKDENKVCAKSFLSIHELSQQKMRTILDKVTVTGTLERDKRGTGKNIHKVSDACRGYVTHHIKRMLALSSTFSSNLNINKFYAKYCDWLSQNFVDEKPDSNNFYHEVFNENFSLGFSPSSADTCN